MRTWRDETGKKKKKRGRNFKERVTDMRIINEACCYLTLPEAREGRGAEEQLPTLVFLV